MPLYDYRCKDCAKTFELLVKMSDTPVCPECGGRNMEKQVSRPAPPGQTAALISKARAQAAREGHFSNYKSSERPRNR
ncbi:MAG TPA: zinc ribbon domain-containing protein [Methylococcaceae bacterium]|nr:zinc ribbon domain-containing protein [Methylococcaceae bacterium]